MAGLIIYKTENSLEYKPYVSHTVGRNTKVYHDVTAVSNTTATRIINMNLVSKVDFYERHLKPEENEIGEEETYYAQIELFDSDEISAFPDRDTSGRNGYRIEYQEVEGTEEVNKLRAKVHRHYNTILKAMKAKSGVFHLTDEPDDDDDDGESTE